MKFGLRLLMSLVGFTALTMALPAFAGDMVTFSGQARTRAEFNDNSKFTDSVGTSHAAFSDSDNQEFWLNRFRFTADVAPSSSVKARVTTQFDNTYGDGALAEVAAHEAWMAWTINNMWSVTAGRQVWHLGNGMIVGANDWGNTYASGTHEDGLKFVASHSMGTTLLAYAKLRESSTGVGAAASADKDLWVMYNMFDVSKSTNMFKNLDLYFLGSSDRQTGSRRHDFTFGARADGVNGSFDYNVELAAQMIKHSAAVAVTGVTGTDDGKGFAANVNVGHKYMAHHFAGELGYFNSEWQSQFQSNHGKRGNADLFTNQNNLTYFAVKTDWGWNDKITSSINGWWFMATKDSSGSVGGMAVATGQRQVALEADFVLNYKADKNLGIDAGYAVAKAGTAVKNSAASMDHAVSKLYLQGTMSF